MDMILDQFLNFEIMRKVWPLLLRVQPTDRIDPPFLFLALLLTVVSSRRAVGTTDVQELLRQSQTQSEAPIAPAPLGGTPVQTAPAAGGESNPTAPATPQPAAPQPQPQQ